MAGDRPNPSAHFSIYLHGDCLVCLQPLDVKLPKQEIALMKKNGNFPRIMPDGSVRMSTTSLLWLHANHLN
jgi:hypothetical protein